MFLYRDEVYNKESPDRGAADVLIAKHRAGPIGSCGSCSGDSSPGSTTPHPAASIDLGVPGRGHGRRDRG